MNDFLKIKLEAKSLMDSGEFEKAADKFLQIRALDKNDFDVIICLGLAFANLKDIDNAIRWLTRRKKSQLN